MIEAYWPSNVPFTASPLWNLFSCDGHKSGIQHWVHHGKDLLRDWLIMVTDFKNIIYVCIIIDTSFFDQSCDCFVVSTWLFWILIGETNAAMSLAISQSEIVVSTPDFSSATVFHLPGFWCLIDRLYQSLIHIGVKVNVLTLLVRLWGSIPTSTRQILWKLWTVIFPSMASRKGLLTPRQDTPYDLYRRFDQALSECVTNTIPASWFHVVRQASKHIYLSITNVCVHHSRVITFLVELRPGWIWVFLSMFAMNQVIHPSLHWNSAASLSWALGLRVKQLMQSSQRILGSNCKEVGWN